jgi:flagellar biosynthesis protein FlhF
METRWTAEGVEVVAAAERPRPESARRARSAPVAPLHRGRERRDGVAARVARFGLDEPLAARVAEAALDALPEEALDDEARLRAFARDLLALWLPVAPARPAEGVLALVGAPGVGKTTTLAKLAAHAALEDPRRVVLASADDRRLGGLEEARAFARALGLRFAALPDRAALDSLVAAAGPGAAIFVDTPGVAAGDEPTLDRVAALLESVPPDRVEMLLPADGEREALLRTARRLEPLGAGALGFARLDEASRSAALAGVIDRIGLPLRHLSGGPDVPERVRTAEPRSLADWLIAGEPPFALGGQAPRATEATTMERP